MDILVTYDVKTMEPAGRRRLRKVATICKNYGQRVQLSVFECRVNEMQYEQLKADLQDTIDQTQDSIRLYRLVAPREKHVEAYGIDSYTDFEEPLIF